MLASRPNVPSILPHPPAPTTLQEAGLSLDLVLQLVLKTLHFVGELSGADIASRLGVSSGIPPRSARAEAAAPGGGLGRLDDRRNVVQVPHNGRGTRSRAALPESNHYVGATPVPLEQKAVHVQVQEEGAAYCHTGARAPGLLAPRHQRPRDGPARARDQRRPFHVRLRSSRQRQDRHLPGHPEAVDGDLHVPHALEIEGEIVRLFDPVVHEELPERTFPPAWTAAPKWTAAGSAAAGRW